MRRACLQVDDSSGSIEYLVRQKALVSIAAEVTLDAPRSLPSCPSAALAFSIS